MKRVDCSWPPSTVSLQTTFLLTTFAAALPVDVVVLLVVDFPCILWSARRILLVGIAFRSITAGIKIISSEYIGAPASEVCPLELVAGTPRPRGEAAKTPPAWRLLKASRFFGSSSRIPSRTTSTLFAVWVVWVILVLPVSAVVLLTPSTGRGETPEAGLAISAPHLPPIEVVGLLTASDLLGTLVESSLMKSEGECCFFAYLERSRDISSFTTTFLDSSVEFSRSMIIGLLEDRPVLSELAAGDWTGDDEGARVLAGTFTWSEGVSSVGTGTDFRDAEGDSAAAAALTAALKILRVDRGAAAVGATAVTSAPGTALALTSAGVTLKLPSVANREAFGAAAAVGATLGVSVGTGNDGALVIAAGVVWIAGAADAGVVEGGTFSGGAAVTVPPDRGICKVDVAVTRKLLSLANREGLGGGADTTDGALIFGAGDGDKILLSLVPTLWEGNFMVTFCNASVLVVCGTGRGGGDVVSTAESSDTSPDSVSESPPPDMRLL